MVKKSKAALNSIQNLAKSRLGPQKIIIEDVTDEEDLKWFPGLENGHSGEQGCDEDIVACFLVPKEEGLVECGSESDFGLEVDDKAEEIKSDAVLLKFAETLQKAHDLLLLWRGREMLAENAPDITPGTPKGQDATMQHIEGTWPKKVTDL